MNKDFKAFGVASGMYTSPELAAGDTYTTNNGELFPTPLIFNENPYNEDVKNASKIFEIGFGVGRNVKWIMENTNADYYGVEPNPSMFDSFWNFNNKIYSERIHLYRSFEEMPKVNFDVVISTFVFQHIGYMPDGDTMNVSDITKLIRNNTSINTVWILLEHDSEDSWIDIWCWDNNISPDVYIRGYKGIEELTHRDYTTKDGHHLIIWKEK